MLMMQVLWLCLPVVIAGVLHMLVVKRQLLSWLALPLDGGLTLGGIQLLGPNKTWRGVLVMVAASAAVGALQGALGGAWAERAGWASVDALQLGGGSFTRGYAWLNAVFGLGYVLGELPNSFAKRRLGIAPGLHGRGLAGRLFLLLDHCDSVLAALVLAAVTCGVPWKVVLVGVPCLSLVHLAVTASLHRARLKENL
jgi:CDP-diglyceride synthetase